MRHHHSVEILHHFRCARCARQWSIADFQTLAEHPVAQRQVIACPFCGTTAGFPAEVMETLPVADSERVAPI